MSIRAMTCVWERSRAKGSGLLVLLCIADYAKNDGRFAWPSTRTLAARSRLSERNVWLLLSNLVTDGELVVDNDTQPGRRYLHLRCVFEEWPPIPEVLRRTGGRSSEAPPAEVAKPPTVTEGPPAKFAGGYTPPGLQSLQPVPAVEQGPPLIPVAGDPDPSRNRQGKEQEQARPLDEPVEAVQIRTSHYKVILRVAHDVLVKGEKSGQFATLGDQVVGLREACTALGLLYTPDLLARAITHALRSRANPPRPSRFRP